MMMQQWMWSVRRVARRHLRRIWALRDPIYPVGAFYRREDGQWMQDFIIRRWHPVYWWWVMHGKWGGVRDESN